VVALLSLFLLGSPGCGCGDDELTPPSSGQPNTCCCTFEWLPPPNVAFRDVVITVENEDPSLHAVVNPSLLLGVIGREFETFTVCVWDNHALGATLDLVFTDNVSAVEYGRAQLIYEVRCTPTIEPLTPEMNLTSPDCGGQTLQCCCDFEWLPGPNTTGDVTLALENQGASLNGTVSPTTLLGVNPRELRTFTVCVDADHTLGESMQLVIRQSGSGTEIGRVTLRYDERCIPTVVPVAAGPTLDVTSTDCGGSPLLCCCNFEWLPDPNTSGDVTLSAQNPSLGLNVQITPSTLTGVNPGVVEAFEVCINADHNLLDNFVLVITTSPGGVEVGRAQIVYRLRCTPEIGDVVGAPTLALGTTDCGNPLQCCCDIEWLAPTAWNPPPGPWTATLENVDGTLQTATITPSSIDIAAGVPTFVIFTVCVNPGHTIGAAMDIVLRDATGAEFSRLPVDYNFQCVPFPGDPSGEGFWNVLCLLGKPGR